MPSVRQRISAGVPEHVRVRLEGQFGNCGTRRFRGTTIYTIYLWYFKLMPEQSVIVWDLETIPDLTAAARMLDVGTATETEVREALGPGFPKHPLHKIACIGALVASRQPEGWRVDALGAPHTGERPEAELIKAFADRISQLRPQMITWNGHTFDLPVLR